MAPLTPSIHLCGKYDEKALRKAKLFEAPTKIFKIDNFVKAHGHMVLRLPPYMLNLNMFEFVWAQVKKHVPSKHPITRFIARYITTSHQQDYEKYMHYLYQEDEKAKMRALTREIQEKMSEKHDYQAYYYRPVTAKYHRVTKEVTEETKHIFGDTE